MGVEGEAGMGLVATLLVVTVLVLGERMGALGESALEAAAVLELTTEVSPGAAAPAPAVLAHSRSVPSGDALMNDPPLRPSSAVVRRLFPMGPTEPREGGRMTEVGVKMGASLG